MRKYLSNVHKVRGAHLQCMNNHYAKFEYKGMKTVGVTDYANLAPQKCCGQTDGRTYRTDVLRFQMVHGFANLWG